jgi:hypothetical protein
VRFRSFIENCVLLSYYAASSGNFVPTFRNNPSAQSSGVLAMGPIVCPEMSVTNCQPTPRKSREATASVLSDMEDIRYEFMSSQNRIWFIPAIFNGATLPQTPASKKSCPYRKFTLVFINRCTTTLELHWAGRFWTHLLFFMFING